MAARAIVERVFAVGAIAGRVPPNLARAVPPGWPALPEEPHSAWRSLRARARRAERVTVFCPDPEARRRPDALRHALADLKHRGISVEIVETAGPIRPKQPIDARAGARPLVDGLRGWAPPSATCASKPPPGLPADDRAALLRLGFEAVG